MMVDALREWWPLIELNGEKGISVVQPKVEKCLQLKSEKLRWMNVIVL